MIQGELNCARRQFRYVLGQYINRNETKGFSSREKSLNKGRIGKFLDKVKAG